MTRLNDWYWTVLRRISDRTRPTGPVRRGIARWLRNFCDDWVAPDTGPRALAAYYVPFAGTLIKTQSVYGSKDAPGIQLWFMEEDYAEFTAPTRIHPALHLCHHDQEEVIRRFKNTNEDIGVYPMQIIWEQFKTETERMVDSLSYVIAPHMPKWRDEKGAK